MRTPPLPCRRRRVVRSALGALLAVGLLTADSARAAVPAAASSVAQRTAYLLEPAAEGADVVQVASDGSRRVLVALRPTAAESGPWTGQLCVTGDRAHLGV